MTRGCRTLATTDGGARGQVALGRKRCWVVACGRCERAASWKAEGAQVDLARWAAQAKLGQAELVASGCGTELKGRRWTSAVWAPNETGREREKGKRENEKVLTF
jgi:hypothetical protein